MTNLLNFTCIRPGEKLFKFVLQCYLSHTNIFHTQIQNFAKLIENNLKFSLTQEIDANICFVDILIQRISRGLEIDILRKPASNDTVIHFYTKHTAEHKTADFQILLTRKHQLPFPIGINKKK